MNFSKEFVLQKSVAIIGSNGKTSLCYRLCKENKDKKTLFTTTTKIFPPNAHEMGLDEAYFHDGFSKSLDELNYGVNVFGKPENSKLSSIEHDKLHALYQKSDLFIYEADGSKQKPLKAWNDYEPVFLDFTEQVIAVMPINQLGCKVCEDNIHRFELFCQKFGVKSGDIIDERLFLKIIDEMFKKAPKKAEKILFFNRYETKYEKNVKLIASKLENIKTFYGSIQEGRISKA